MRNCKIIEKKEIAILQFPNKFEVLTNRVMNVKERSRGEVRKDKRMILREKKEKKRSVEVRKIRGEGESLKEVTVKIGVKRMNRQERITVEALLDSGVTGLVMSSEFARRKRFKLKKIERPIYIRNINETFNKEGLIEYIV